MREVAIFVALRMEMSPLRALLSRVDQVDGDIPTMIGQMGGRKVILVRSGVGKERAVAAAEFIHSTYSPAGVLSTGFCGGLVPDLWPSDVVLSSWVVPGATASHRDPKKLFLGDQALLLQRVLNGRGIRVHVGGFACVSQPVVSPTAREALAQRTGAMIAEMETFYLGAFFTARKVPFVGMRTVVDSLEDRNPLLESAMKMGKWSGTLNMLGYVMSHGSGLVHVWRLYRNGRRAQSSLGKAVAAVIRAWP